jgi:hypothetical protein
VIFGALQVTKVLSTEEVKRAIEGSGKDFGKSIECGAQDTVECGALESACIYVQYRPFDSNGQNTFQMVQTDQMDNICSI